MKLRKVLAASVATVVAASALTAVAAAADYNGYLGFQTAAWSFRNSWADTGYGIDSGYHNGVFVWGGNSDETFPDLIDIFDYDEEGYFFSSPDNIQLNDAKITGDGTYTVSIENFDWALDSASSFNLIFVSTDIPSDAGVTITDAKLIIDGVEKAVYATPEVDPDKPDHLHVLLTNIWNTNVESYTGDYPTESLAIEFTVNGLGGGAAAGDTTSDVAGDTAAGDTSADTGAADKGNADTGIEGVAAIAGLAVLAAAGVVVSKKRK